MAFGQAAGPPAGMRQIEELAALLERAGFSSFREARHPYGLTQRQAAGKFTAPEAAELIDRLAAAEIVQQSTDDVDGAGEARVTSQDRQPASSRATGRSGANARSTSAESTAGAAPRPRSAASVEARRRREERRAEQLNALSDEVIAAELERRGWCCIPPLQDPLQAAPLQDPPIDPG